MNTYRLKIDGMGCTHCVSKAQMNQLHRFIADASGSA